MKPWQIALFPGVYVAYMLHALAISNENASVLIKDCEVLGDIAELLACITK